MVDTADVDSLDVSSKETLTFAGPTFILSAGSGFIPYHSSIIIDS